jgi:serine phosphatase RsbU (regulator of sigma subunit)
VPFATIRSTLLALIGTLGLVVLGLAVVQLSDHYALYREAQQQFAVNIARGQVARAALAVGRERDAAFLALAVGAEVKPASRAETDRSLAAYDEAAEGYASGENIAAGLLQRMAEMRASADRALSEPLNSPARQRAAVTWFEGTSAAVEELRAVRLRLLNKSGTDAALFSQHYLRSLTLILLDEIMKNGALLELEIARHLQGESPDPTAEAEPPLAGSRFDPAVSVGPFEEFLAALGTQDGSTVETFDAKAYAAAEAGLRDALRTGESVNEAILRWRRVSGAAILQLDELQASTFRVAQERAASLGTDARYYMVTWAVILFASLLLLGVASWVVLRGVVAPLERIRGAMLELAHDNLSVRLPTPSPIREIKAMGDALRVFKANAIRRRRLNEERLKLHGRLEEMYTHLEGDVQAAAAVQASLLPQQADMAGIALSSYFRPSHYLAGDTFDVLQDPHGRVIVFQIDVAGHGAAAALVSVASKYTVAQAILQRQQGTSLAEMVAEINREWPSGLPFFTLLIAEIDPESERGELVQAGHPSPILLRADGNLLVLGDGGLPIGVLSQATFDTVPFPFAPNDRLLITTDGALELENQKGEPFSDERLQKMLLGAERKSTKEIITELDEALRGWRGDDSLEDDVTIVVLEGKWTHGHH